MKFEAKKCEIQVQNLIGNIEISDKCFQYYTNKLWGICSVRKFLGSDSKFFID